MRCRKIIQRAFRFYYTHFVTFLQPPPVRGPPPQHLLPFCRPPSPSPFTYLGNRRLNQFKCLRYPRPYRSYCCESCIVMQMPSLLYAVYTFLLYSICIVCLPDFPLTIVGLIFQLNKLLKAKKAGLLLAFYADKNVCMLYFEYTHNGIYCKYIM